MRRLPPARVLGLTLALGLVGCQRPSTEAYVRALERMAEITERHRSHCSSMGRALARFFEEEGAAIRTYQDQIHRLPKEEREALDGPVFRPRVRRAMARLVPGHRRCFEHPEVRAAYAHL